MNVVVAGPEKWDFVRRFVETLLHELGDEAEDTGELRPELRQLWEAQPDRMFTVIAYANGGEDEPIGLLTLVESFAIYANGAFGIIPEMYVAPEWRSKGVGKRLIERAAAFGRERGWSRIDVTGPESAEPRTIAFYEGCGFRFAGPKLKLALDVPRFGKKAAMQPQERRRGAPLERRYVRFLAEIGAIFGEPLPYEATLQRVCEAAVLTIADTATMYLYDENRELKVAGAAHAHKERSEGLRVRVEAILRDPNGPRAWLESVVRGGHGILVEHVDESSIDSVAVGSEHARYLRDAGVRSFIVVPVVAQQSELRGLLALVYTRESGLHYDADALILAEDIGRRCGAALEKVRAHEAAVDVSTRFQLAALPRTLPQVAGFELDSFYEPATSEMLVGGDWYDAFLLPDGRIGMTVGDISGHGVEAAAFMGSLRNVLRVAMFMEPDLLKVLDAADMLLKQEAKAGMFATTNIAVVDPRSRTITCAAAGHPGPLCWSERRQSVSDPFTDRGLPLGFRELATPQDAAETIELEDRSFVCFFTDGLLEGERDYMAGELRLERVIARRQIRESRYPAWSIRHAVAPKHHPDDLAVMTLRLP